MKKQSLALLFSLLVAMQGFAVQTWNGTASSAWTQGNGTAASPYIISSPAHLKYLQTQVNAGTTYAGKYFRQTDDFNLNSQTWTSIGTSTYKFAGIYDGNGKYIRNMKNTLFGYINNAEIKNLTIDGTYSGSGSGVFVTHTDGAIKITNCHNKATTSGTISAQYFGCIVGRAEGTSITFENCSNQGTANIAGISNNTSGSTLVLYMGGIIGNSTTTTTTLKNCYNSGSIQMSKSVYNNGYDKFSYRIRIGGLIGGADGNVTIDQCYNTGTVTATGGGTGGGKVDTDATGLANCPAGTLITQCYGTGTITSTAAGNDGISVPRASAYALGSNANHTACYVVNCTMNVTAPGSSAYTIFGGGSFESCYFVGGAGPNGSNVYSNYNSTTTTSIYKSDDALKAPSMIPLLNTLDEYFTADYEGINGGYPILKWQAGVRCAINATCDPNRGTVSGGGEYPLGYEITLAAKPKAGSTFVGWSDGNTDNPRTVTVTGEALYVAQFIKSNYIIYVNQDCSSYME